MAGRGRTGSSEEDGEADLRRQMQLDDADAEGGEGEEAEATEAQVRTAGSEGNHLREQPMHLGAGSGAKPNTLGDGAAGGGSGGTAGGAGRLHPGEPFGAAPMHSFPPPPAPPSGPSPRMQLRAQLEALEAENKRLNAKLERSGGKEPPRGSLDEIIVQQRATQKREREGHSREGSEADGSGRQRQRGTDGASGSRPYGAAGYGGYPALGRPAQHRLGPPPPGFGAAQPESPHLMPVSDWELQKAMKAVDGSYFGKAVEDLVTSTAWQYGLGQQPAHVMLQLGEDGRQVYAALRRHYRARKLGREVAQPPAQGGSYGTAGGAAGAATAAAAAVAAVPAAGMGNTSAGAGAGQGQEDPAQVPVPTSQWLRFSLAPSSESTALARPGPPGEVSRRAHRAWSRASSRS